MDETEATNETTAAEGNIEEELNQEEENQQEEQQETQETVEYNQIYSEQIELSNHLISGQIFFMGLIFGAIIFKIFWDRFRI